MHSCIHSFIHTYIHLFIQSHFSFFCVCACVCFRGEITPTIYTHRHWVNNSFKSVTVYILLWTLPQKDNMSEYEKWCKHFFSPSFFSALAFFQALSCFKQLVCVCACFMFEVERDGMIEMNNWLCNMCKPKRWLKMHFVKWIWNGDLKDFLRATVSGASIQCTPQHYYRTKWRTINALMKGNKIHDLLCAKRFANEIIIKAGRRDFQFHFCGWFVRHCSHSYCQYTTDFTPYQIDFHVVFCVFPPFNEWMAVWIFSLSLAFLFRIGHHPKTIPLVDILSCTKKFY